MDNHLQNHVHVSVDFRAGHRPTEGTITLLWQPRKVKKAGEVFWFLKVSGNLNTTNEEEPPPFEAEEEERVCCQRTAGGLSKG